ncbi:MAG: 30S ribosomal protein S12 methylthiotransferase RimO [Candidatus Dadabacteria bacterium]|nr:30S ribosomal protein S12 methylthiotransferase RimO [Candidatus Dadabacteria bacterium]
MENNLKKIALVSLGCSKNLVDSELILGSLVNSGKEIVSEAEAEVIIVNTCGFIGDAKKESINTTLDLLQYKKTGKCKKFVLTGCLVERYSNELKKEMPEIDAFWGTGNLFKINSLIDEFNIDDSINKLNYKPGTLYDPDSPRIQLSQPHTSYVKVSEGCSRTCTFCIIPKMRGLMKSRTVESIKSEIEILGSKGVKEINLIAQDMTSYGRDIGTNLNNLLKNISKIDEIDWIRIHYCYPWGIDNLLLDIIENEEKILPYIDMPLQHINDRILKLMDRKTTKSKTIDILKRLKSNITNLTLRSTFIVGFPSETENEFAELIDFIKEFEFDKAGVFKYSKEEGTKAALMEAQIDEEIKEERLERLMNVQSDISFVKNKKLINTIQEGFIEGKENDRYFARIPSQAPEVDGITYITNNKNYDIGQKVKIRITNADVYDLIGTTL